MQTFKPNYFISALGSKEENDQKEAIIQPPLISKPIGKNGSTYSLVQQSKEEPPMSHKSIKIVFSVLMMLAFILSACQPVAPQEVVRTVIVEKMARP